MPSDTFSLILPADRDPDGYYMMLNGQIHVFPFKVVAGASTDISFLHTMDYAQDFTVRCWFSDHPNGPPLFKLDDVDIFAMGRQERTVTVWDSALALREDTRLLWDSSRLCYFNVQNVQNSSNGYRLDFSF